MKRLQRVVISFSLIIGFGDWLSTGAAIAERVKVKIITKTFENLSVNARIERRVNGGEWAVVQVTTIGVGVYEVSEEKCDSSIEYRAVSHNSYYGIREAKIESCKFPEVVFAEFYLTGTVGRFNFDKFTEKSAWVAAFGKLDAAEDYGEIFSTQLSSAFAKGEYGTIAILGSEVATQLRQAGKMQDADAFAALSVDATARGAAVQQNIAADTLEILIFDPVANRFVLSDQGKLVVQTYQTQNLGFTTSTTTLGKADWKTMRSLSGGSSVSSAQLRLPDAAIAEFSAGPLLSAERM